MANWVPEGTWGLDLFYARNSGSTPSLTPTGSWISRYVNCTRRPDVSGASPVAATGNNNSGCGSSLYQTLLTSTAYRDTYVDSTNPVNANEMWYVDGVISDLSFDFVWSDFGGRPPEAPDPGVTGLDFDWDDYFAVEYQRTVSVSEPFRYLFYARSDDGVRIGITPFPSTGEIQLFDATSSDVNTRVATDEYTYGGNTYAYNNIINSWRNQSPTVSQGEVTLVPESNGAPKEYTITVHYFEQTGGGEISVGIAGASASFSDSPLQVPSLNEGDRIPANYYSNTSIYLDGLLDLRSANVPIIQYYNRAETSDISGTRRFEVSEDGGFTWTQTGLGNNPTLSDGSSINTDNSPTRTDNDNHNNTGWTERIYDLSSYSGSLISLRFSLEIPVDENTVNNQASNNGRAWDGLNIDDILVFDVEPPSAQPTIVSQSEASNRALLGEPLTLEVIASGTSPLRYQWYQGPTLPTDPNVIPPDATEIVAAAGQSTYTVPTDVVGTYYYWARVSNTISDNNASIDPAISNLFTVGVTDCVAQNLGECGVYRINFNGNDIATNDPTQLSWAGTNQSANSGLFTRSVATGDQTAVGVPSSHQSLLVQAAINDDMDSEELYERWYRFDSTISWSLPVPNGTYVVKLYMADWRDINNPETIDSSGSIRNSGPMIVTVEGNVATVSEGGISQVLDGSYTPTTANT
ncbi:MAG: hypothetical protein AAF125_16005, partial [Chloroflexota bacterium]